jgi:hypothetical protein
MHVCANLKLSQFRRRSAGTPPITLPRHHDHVQAARAAGAEPSPG